MGLPGALEGRSMILIIKAACHEKVPATQTGRLLLFDLCLSLHYSSLTSVLLEHFVPLSQLCDPAHSLLGLDQPLLRLRIRFP